MAATYHLLTGQEMYACMTASGRIFMASLG